MARGDRTAVTQRGKTLPATPDARPLYSCRGGMRKKGRHGVHKRHAQVLPSKRKCEARSRQYRSRCPCIDASMRSEHTVVAGIGNRVSLLLHAPCIVTVAHSPDQATLASARAAHAAAHPRPMEYATISHCSSVVLRKLRRQWTIRRRYQRRRTHSSGSSRTRRNCRSRGERRCESSIATQGSGSMGGSVRFQPFRRACLTRTCARKRKCAFLPIATATVTLLHGSALGTNSKIDSDQT